jgi:hypothetical protein
MENMLTAYDVYKAGVAGNDEGMRRQQAAAEMAAYGDAVQEQRYQNRLMHMANDETARKKSTANIVAEALYGNQLSAQSQVPAVTNQLSPPAGQPAPATGQMPPTTPPQQQVTNQLSPPAGQPPAGQPPAGQPPQPPTTDYNQQRAKLRDLYNSGKITAADAQGYDQQITAQETSERSARATSKISLYKEFGKQLADNNNNEGFQELMKQAQNDPDVAHMMPKFDSIKVTGKGETEITRQYTAEELKGLATKFPELGITPDTPPGGYKIGMKGDKPVKWEPVKETQTPEGGYYDGLKADISKANPTWDKKKVEMVAGKQIIAEKAKAAATKTEMTFKLKEAATKRVDGETPPFAKWDADTKKVWFDMYKLDKTAIPPFGFRDASSKRAFGKEFAEYVKTGKTNGSNVVMGRADLKANNDVIRDIKKRDALVGTYTGKIDENTKMFKAMRSKYGANWNKMVNMPINTLGRYMGSGDLASLKLVLKSTSNEVAKVESGSLGVAEVSIDQAKEMARIHDMDMTMGELEKVLNTGVQLGKNAHKANRAQIDSLERQRTEGDSASLTDDTAPAASGGLSHSSLLDKYRNK